jgi:transcriptional regulator with XRE-family HTH domain
LGFSANAVCRLGIREFCRAVLTEIGTLNPCLRENRHREGLFRQLQLGIEYCFHTDESCSMAQSSIATRITNARLARGLSRPEFAELLGVTPTAVWNWEEKGMVPRVKMLTRIADVLGVSASFLRTGKESEVSTKSPKSIAEVLQSARRQIAALSGEPLNRIKLDLHIG